MFKTNKLRHESPLAEGLLPKSKTRWFVASRLIEQQSQYIHTHLESSCCGVITKYKGLGFVLNRHPLIKECSVPMYNKHICTTLAGRATPVACTQFKAFVAVPQLHKELSKTILITGLQHSKQHAEDKRKGMLVKPKQQGVSDLCRVTTQALVNLCYRRVLLIFYQGWSCHLLPGTLPFGSVQKQIIIQKLHSPISSSCNIFQLSAGLGAELAETGPRQSMEMLIGRGIPFCIALCVVSQGDWPPTSLFFCRMPRKMLAALRGGCFHFVLSCSGR